MLGTTCDRSGRCRAGVVITLGHGSDIGEGIEFAEAVNALAADELPRIFDGAAFDAFASLIEPPGLVDLRLYFYSGCVSAESTIVLDEVTDVPGRPSPTSMAAVATVVVEVGDEPTPRFEPTIAPSE